MTDKEIILFVLGDREPHLVEEIEAVARAKGKPRITVHSRVSELRTLHSYEIRSFKTGGKPGYQLVAQREGVQRVSPKKEPVVQGYVFQSVAESGELSKQNGNICQLVRRAVYPDVSEQEVMDYGPAFVVKFGSGTVTVVHSSELHPWYPT